MLKKNNHTHKIIFTWFGNMPTSTELQGFHYYQGKRNTRCGYSFSSPIKNHAILFGLGQVIKPDQIKLGSIKPNTCISHKSLLQGINTLGVRGGTCCSGV